MADVCITEFTDPGCPWAYSAEPFRRRLAWLYGDQIEWKARMVGLAGTPEEYVEKGFTPEKQSAAYRKISHDHRMPIDTAQRPRMAATLPACRAVVAARLHAPDRERVLLRRLRVRNFSGELLDERSTLDHAAQDAGIDPEELHRWAEGDDIAAALEADMTAAREPLPAAQVLDEKLANWSGGRRYTCPSYEIVRKADGVRIAVPGFQPTSPRRARAATRRAAPRRCSRGRGRRWPPRRSRSSATSPSRRRARSSAASPSSSRWATTGSGRCPEPAAARRARACPRPAGW